MMKRREREREGEKKPHKTFEMDINYGMELCFLTE